MKSVSSQVTRIKSNPRQFSIVFGTDENRINAESYGAALCEISNLVSRLTKEDAPGFQLDFHVVSERKGSFIADGQLVPIVVIGLGLPVTAANYAAYKTVVSGVVKGVSKVLELWKKLNGKEPKRIEVHGDNATIVSFDGAVINLTNSELKVGTDQSVADGLSKMFAKFTQDQELDSIGIHEGRKKLVTIDRKEFSDLARHVKVIKPTINIIREKAIVYPVRQSFYKNKKNDFIYKGFEIPAKILDEGFWQRIDADEMVAKADSFEVILEIEQRLDKTVDAYRNKKYTVVEVLKHTHKTKPPKLFIHPEDHPERLLTSTVKVKAPKQLPPAKIKVAEIKNQTKKKRKPKS